MAKLPVIQYPHPVLAAKAERIEVFDEDLKRLAADMAETMYAAPGVGLAANQVGVLRRIVVIDVTDDKTGLLVLCNPEIIEKSEELQDHEEGCLSLKGLYEHVKRPAQVRVRAQNADGKTFELDCSGLLAVCVQHELDHLDGVVFIDHLSLLKKQRACTKLRKLRREEREKEKEKEQERAR
ncbi:peptide deformylase [Sutterella sp.]|uniref:peptide deformylase n=1 Tax=Sutterella sp. TaxID=1981025 RepID=UPI0025F6820F|nr:peptide deformylase [uncultured Sutterella sp.]